MKLLPILIIATVLSGCKAERLQEISKNIDAYTSSAQGQRDLNAAFGLPSDVVEYNQEQELYRTNPEAYELRKLRKALVNKLNQPQQIQNNSVNCTSRRSGYGVVSTNCY